MMLRVRTVLSGWAGGPGLNTFYFDWIAPSTPALGAPDVVARVRSFWSGIAALFPTTFSAQVQANVDDLDPSNGQLLGTYSGGAPAVVAGATAGGYNAYATAVLLRENTNTVQRGRRVVGRSFIGPVASAVDSGGNPLASNVTTLLTQAATMLTGTTTAFPVVWSRPNLANVGASYQVTNYTAAPYFAVLRSRRD